jgi:hypothetical protein
MTSPRIGHRWRTVAIVGYTGAVSRDQDRRAHGGVCLLQLRRQRGGGILARRVNSNGRHAEVGTPWTPDADTVAHWGRIGGAQ